MDTGYASASDGRYLVDTEPCVGPNCPVQNPVECTGPDCPLPSALPSKTPVSADGSSVVPTSKDCSDGSCTVTDAKTLKACVGPECPVDDLVGTAGGSHLDDVQAFGVGSGDVNAFSVDTDPTFRAMHCEGGQCDLPEFSSFDTAQLLY
jgi:hypothetical protein